ncbi:group 1 glycosyl transferase : Glycosyl transferase group 1 OS=Cyanothece sp. (strain PCC 7425 / ATCC 29141) GN=Cyan7425_1106 PE=4 SV=1: Glycos_transf_1 [Gemmataceae bacterium]|nr:group 1 glycosyl transferase : Glycosyl transferase group 1 OS=Cyanothece sp. (strain PCC 7425 / ATCC 29141) GN=Cyan7425_1106 PE=4 SV=1: Glycos_transf_1 [Gemmataceae bacterium]VTU00929.1 group 1 glycosyl transferase : Glycosyl transferase group 1 OS=Cyanothece sp. (strain PCC 7425 / ATCC 29141) GN=Cyan7425_1106 PE=4 SV=1: Glycos_transf_1 [Gemmataceae bacterium]
MRDFRAEGWPSMNLCADQLLAHLPPGVGAVDVAPAFVRVASRIAPRSRTAFNADRFLNRHVFLPPVVRRAARHADFVHVVDHSYAHAVAAVPPGRAGVYCHDLDAFRSVLEPDKAPRPWWFRRMARRTLDGLRRAIVVFHSTHEIGAELVRHGVAPADRLVHAPYGVADEFTPAHDPTIALPVVTTHPYLLSVASGAPRKRLDVLLDVFAAVRERVPGLRLVRVGGPWPPGLADRVAELGPAVTHVGGLSRGQLAELYRRAAAVLVTSDAEGFGLPVIEALACGAIVVASDLPTLREAGGDAAIYCSVADVPTWAGVVTTFLTDPRDAPARNLRLRHAARFSWGEHARIITESYQRLRS